MSFSDRPYDSAFAGDAERAFEKAAAPRTSPQNGGFNRFDRQNGLLHLDHQRDPRHYQQQQQQHMLPVRAERGFIGRQGASDRNGSVLLSRAQDSLHQGYDSEEDDGNEHGFLYSRGVRRDIMIALGIGLFAMLLWGVYNWWKLRCLKQIRVYESADPPRAHTHSRSCGCRGCILPRGQKKANPATTTTATARMCPSAQTVVNPFAGAPVKAGPPTANSNNNNSVLKAPTSARRKLPLA